eukprot:GHVL01018376.1.p1 GENE.GHVL01018376.1~~GHVL01018376.1.p1  ORF type:complete len:460 (+),score=71.25 GHVL01018376.1:38-1381(+)
MPSLRQECVTFVDNLAKKFSNELCEISEKPQLSKTEKESISSRIILKSAACLPDTSSEKQSLINNPYMYGRVLLQKAIIRDSFKLKPDEQSSDIEQFRDQDILKTDIPKTVWGFPCDLNAAINMSEYCDAKMSQTPAIQPTNEEWSIVMANFLYITGLWDARECNNAELTTAATVIGAFLIVFCPNNELYQKLNRSFHALTYATYTEVCIESLLCALRFMIQLEDMSVLSFLINEGGKPSAADMFFYQSVSIIKKTSASQSHRLKILAAGLYLILLGQKQRTLIMHSYAEKKKLRGQLLTKSETPKKQRKNNSPSRRGIKSPSSEATELEHENFVVQSLKIRQNAVSSAVRSLFQEKESSLSLVEQVKKKIKALNIGSSTNSFDGKKTVCMDDLCELMLELTSTPSVELKLESLTPIIDIFANTNHSKDDSIILLDTFGDDTMDPLE